MFEILIKADDRLANALERIADGLEGYAPAVSIAPAPTVGVATNTPKGPKPQTEEDEAPEKRRRVSQAMRDESKALVEAAGLSLAEVEKEIGKPLASWGSKDCDHAKEMAAARKPLTPTAASQETQTLVEQAKENGEAGRPNTEEQAKALGEHQRALLEAAKAELSAKYADAETAEALFKAQMKTAFGVEFVHQATHTAGFDENYAKLLAAVKAHPGGAKPPVAEPQDVSPENAARIAYLEALDPVGAKFTPEAKDLIITLLKEGKPLGAEDVRCFCIATASAKLLTTVEVGGVVKQFAQSVDHLTPDQIMPCIDAIIAAAGPKDEEGAF